VTNVMRHRLKHSQSMDARTVDLQNLMLCSDPTRAMSKSYKVLDKLGSGGFGSVFRAELLKSNEIRAIKQVSKSDVKDDMDFIYAELETMLRVDHPHVVRLYEYFEDPGFIYLITELCQGGNYSDMDRTNTSEVKMLFRDLILAVAYFHDRGIAHRDLKFENCLIHQEPNHRKVGKVIDFGLAAMKRPGDTSAKWLNATLGTRYFIAPEVINRKITYGVNCDTWSVGVMLYIILTDEHPCVQCANRLDQRAFFSYVLSGRIRKAPLEDANVSKDASDLIMKLLRKDPDSRISMKDAVKHPWLCPGGTLSKSWRSESHLNDTESSRDHKVTCRLCKFGTLNRFEQAILTISAHQAAAKQVDDLRDIFMELDKSNEGSLTREEIKAGLETAGRHMTDSQLDEVFTSVDADRTGRIQYTEWLAATMEPARLTSDELIKKVFHFFDIDGAGKVNRHDLTQVLGTDDLVTKVLSQFDVSGDDSLSFDEFKQMMQDFSRRLCEESPAS